jgi:hypothetical protein
MGRAKEIIVKVIPAKVANEFVKKHHYSGKVVPNSNLHFGCFLDEKLHGVMSFGGSTDKRKTITYCTNTAWNEFLELNRMAFDDYLPKYSESRCISIAIKLIKKMHRTSNGYYLMQTVLYAVMVQYIEQVVFN